jgi:hypothetical protein
MSKTLTWDGQVHGPEVRYAPAPNAPGLRTPLMNPYYWSEISVEGAVRRFYLTVPQFTVQEFSRAIGPDYENLLKQCLGDHVRGLIENDGWVPPSGAEYPVSDDEMSDRLKNQYVRGRD